MLVYYIISKSYCVTKAVFSTKPDLLCWMWKNRNLRTLLSDNAWVYLIRKYIFSPASCNSSLSVLNIFFLFYFLRLIYINNTIWELTHFSMYTEWLFQVLLFLNRDKGFCLVWGLYTFNIKLIKEITLLSL